MKRLLLMPVLLLALLLVGCSEDEPSAGDEPAAEAPPAGTQMVETDDVEFAVPEGWTVVDPDDMAEGAEGNAASEELAARMNVSPGQLQEMMRSVDLYVMTDEADAEFNDNVNVMSVQEPLPSEQQVEQQYELIGGTMTSFEDLEVDGKDAVLLGADISVQGTEYSVEALAVEVDGGSVLVSVSAGDADAARELMADVVETIDLD